MCSLCVRACVCMCVCVCVCVFTGLNFLNSSPRLVILSLSEAGTLSSVGEVLLSETPWDATFDCTNHLWVCLDDSSSPVLCYAWVRRRT